MIILPVERYPPGYEPTVLHQRSEPGKKAHIPTLDGLRAVARVMVISSHLVNRNEMSGLGRLRHVGVLIFFALSGYLITDRLLAEYRMAGTISLRNFYIRRAFRILPPAIVFWESFQP